MRNCLLFCLAGLSFLASSGAQVFIDAHGGANLSNFQLYHIQLTNQADQQSIAGVQAGITPGLALSSQWEISMPLQYVLRGYWTGIMYGRPEQIKAERLHFLEVMPSVAFRPIPRLAFSIGAFASMPLLREKDEGNGWENWRSPFYRYSWDTGFVLGGQSTHGRFIAFVRYQHGLVEIPSSFGIATDGEYIPGYFLNRNFQFGIGYSLVNRDTKKSPITPAGQ